MSQKQFLNYRKLKTLLLQLKQFGLNPNEWRICRKESSVESVVLQNKNDSDFQFLGTTTKQKLGWQNISLVSI